MESLVCPALNDIVSSGDSLNCNNRCSVVDEYVLSLQYMTISALIGRQQTAVMLDLVHYSYGLLYI